MKEVASGGLGASGYLLRIADAISICVTTAFASTDPNGVDLMAIAIAISLGNHGAAAFENGPWTIAYAAGIEGADTVIDTVTDAIAIRIRSAGSSTNPEGIELVAIAVAVSRRTHVTAAFEDGSREPSSNAAVTCVRLETATAMATSSMPSGFVEEPALRMRMAMASVTVSMTVSAPSIPAAYAMVQGPFSNAAAP